MEEILKDISLGKINFNQDATSIKFDIYDLHNQDLIKQLKCCDVFYFEYQNAFWSAQNEDGLPTYLGEIRYSKIEQPFLEIFLKKNQNNMLEIFKEKSNAHYFELESGELIIRICCDSWTLENNA